MMFSWLNTTTEGSKLTTLKKPRFKTQTKAPFEKHLIVIFIFPTLPLSFFLSISHTSCSHLSHILYSPFSSYSLAFSPSQLCIYTHPHAVLHTHTHSHTNALPLFSISLPYLSLPLTSVNEVFSYSLSIKKITAKKTSF